MESYLWFLSDISEGFSEGLEFPKPESPYKGHSWAIWSTWLPSCYWPFCPNPQNPLPTAPPFPGFLNYSILTQRCYLPNTLPTHSCLSCLLLFNSPDPSCFSQTLFPVLIALKGTRGPTDPGAYILACGVKQSCESLKISLLRVANRSCLFRSSLMVSCLIFSLFFSTFTLKTKCPELDCWAGLSLLLGKNK